MKNLTVIDKNNIVKKRLVHSLVRYLSKEIGFEIEELQINFVSNEEILELNKKYLSHNYNTDIITFEYSRNFQKIDGEIFISVDEALNNSKRFKETFENELKRLIIHGILHLTGYDDKKESDKKIMKRMENRLLSNNKFTLL